jgi:hypothetical protein
MLKIGLPQAKWRAHLGDWKVFHVPAAFETLWDCTNREYPLIMIGGILGVVLGWGYLSSSWETLQDGESPFSGFGQAVLALVVCLAVGIFIFPRTVGMMFTPAIFLSPIAFIIGWVRSGFLFGFSLLLFGLMAWGITQIIAKVRPSST